ncbi:uncharacterized protein isoform X3 [Rhodnius prolixus]|uniref:uncharacterized protein isoform X3 n=1 Tax=Rhodnius prolixus TaxID=13249 RepID=UPI003D18D0B1
MIIKCLLVSCLIVLSFNDAESQFGSIPTHLLECYQDDLIILPMSMTTLIDLIRKIELNTDYIMDMRMVANSIMKRFWRDGIEKDPNIFPYPGMLTYTTAGFQSYKYSLVYSGLLPETGSTFPNESLSINERCTLHFILSGSVDPWERGDETQVCRDAALTWKQRRISYELTGVMKSACPIEKGVIWADGFGTINAAHVIAAIAMALQPMQVTQLALIRNYNRAPSKLNFDKLIDNLWATTLSGDLAEVIVFQKPLTNNVTFGAPGKWNNTYLPTDYYMLADQFFLDCSCWQATDAEILGSIDANEAVKWSDLMYSLKLSQLLEMYYTNIGGNFPGQIHVCNRRNYFFDNLKSQHDIIKQQTTNFAEILAAIAPHSFVNNQEYIEENIEEVYKRFMDYTAKTLWDEVSCPKFTTALPKLQLNVIYDSTWSSYDTLQFLSRLSSLVDVSIYGSRITVINGASGAIIVNSGTTQGDLFFQWSNFTDPSKDVKSTNLVNGFLKLKTLVESSSNNTNGWSSNPSGIVTIVLGVSSSLTDEDFSNILSILKNIKNECPDMTFFYIITKSNIRTFNKFLLISKSEDDSIIITDTNNQDRILNDLGNFNKIPRMLIPSPCNGSKILIEQNFDEYVTPELIYTYRIHSSYLCSGNRTVTLKLTNYDYGSIDACVSRDSFTKNLKNAICKTVTHFDETEFNVNNTLETQDSSYKPIYLRVQGARSTRKCTEKGCRFPDQLRYTITVTGLKCVKDLQATCDSCQKKSDRFITLIIIFLSFFIYFCK